MSKDRLRSMERWLELHYSSDDAIYQGAMQLLAAANLIVSVIPCGNGAIHVITKGCGR